MTKRRWLRLALPLAAALLVIAVTGVFHAIEEPDRTDPGYLSPVAGTPTGADDLASRLRARGVTLSRQTRTSDALLLAHRGNATLVLATPGLMHWRYLEMIALLPGSTRVVLVEPGSLDLRQRPGAVDLDRHLLEHPGDPALAHRAACPILGTGDAGRAATTRSRYADPSALACYDQGWSKRPSVTPKWS